MNRRTFLLLAAFCVLIILALLPLPIPPYLDFQVIYHADLGLLRGIPIYDRAGQVNMIAQMANVPPEQVYVLPFPYPPWYALVTLPLALLPIQIAARIWFGLNLAMLFLAVWLMTDEWTSRKRLSSFLFAFLFVPVLGSLFVGQYGFPVLLGASLFGYALRHQRVRLTALAAALLTFKPHLGALILAAGLVYLFFLRSKFSRRALIAILITGLILFAVGFLASPLWPLDYLRSLTGFKDASQCDKCNSLPMELAGLANGGFNQALWFAMGLLVFLILWLVLNWRAVSNEARWLVSATTLVTLFVSPYLQNYDYILLLVPLFALAGHARRGDWFWVFFIYLLPLAGIGFFKAAGYVSFVISAFLAFIFLARILRQLDGSPNAAYNPPIIE